MSIFHKLHRKGLNAVCIPRSIENDIAATAVSFGFNSALSFTIEMLDRVRQAAQSARKIAVVEVLGAEAGWLALQAGIAVCADAVLIPEIPPDLEMVAARMREKVTPRRPYGVVVVAEGVKFTDGQQAQAKESSFKATLSPLATGDASEHVIQRSGQAAETVATRLQLLIAEETSPLVLGPWARGGAPTAVDRQLGLGYGAGALRAVSAGTYGVMMAFVPPDIKFVPLAEAINKVRTVPADSEFIQIARSLGICLGREL
jgi:6-phosphofructokinase 1